MALVWAAETVVTLDVTEDASLPDEPGALNSSSKDVRDAAGSLDEPSGDSGDGNGFMPGKGGGSKGSWCRVRSRSKQGNGESGGGLDNKNRVI